MAKNRDNKKAKKAAQIDLQRRKDHLKATLHRAVIAGSVLTFLAFTSKTMEPAGKVGFIIALPGVAAAILLVKIRVLFTQEERNDELSSNLRLWLMLCLLPIGALVAVSG